METPSNDREALREMARRIVKADYLLDTEFVRMKYAASDMIVSLKPNLGGLNMSEPYLGQAYNPRHARVIQGGWDHDHCSMCSATVMRGDEWWAASPPNQAGLCVECHSFLARLREDIKAGRRADPRLEARRTESDSSATMTEEEWLTSTIPRAMLMTLEGRAKSGRINRKLRLFSCASARLAWHLLEDERSRSAIEVSERYADGLASPDELDAAGHEASFAASGLYVSGGLQAADEARINGAEGNERPAGTVFGEKPGERAWNAASAASKVTARKARMKGVAEGIEVGAWVAALTASMSASDAIARAEELRRRALPWDEAAEALEAPLSSTDAFAGADELRAREAACNAANQARRLYQDHRQANLLRCIFGNPARPVAIDPGCLDPDSVELARSIDEGRSFHQLPELADALEKAGCREAAVLGHCRESIDHARGCWVVDAVLGKS